MARLDLHLDNVLYLNALMESASSVNISSNWTSLTPKVSISEVNTPSSDSMVLQPPAAASSAISGCRPWYAGARYIFGVCTGCFEPTAAQRVVRPVYAEESAGGYVIGSREFIYLPRDTRSSSRPLK